MIKTPMTEMFGIQHPIMLAGMNWISTPKLVAAVCNAGGIGYPGHRSICSGGHEETGPPDSGIDR